MEDYISSLQKYANQIKKLESCAQTYQYIKTTTPLIEQIHFPFYELIDSISCCDSALLTIHHFQDYPDTLPEYCQKDYQLLSCYYAKNKCAHLIFNTPHTFAFQHLHHLWVTAIVNNDITNFARDLDHLRSYLQAYYGHYYHLHNFSYRDLLVHTYDENFVFSHLAPLLHSKILLKNNYQLFLQDNIQPQLHELNFTKQQALDFFNYFIQKSTFISSHYQIEIEFHKSSRITRYQNIRKIILSPYQNFVSALFEFLSFYAQLYLEVLIEKSNFKNICTYNSQTIIYYFQFLPIITTDFARFIASFLYSTKKLIQKKYRTIYHELLAQYMRLRPNPLQLNTMNPLTLFMTKLIELEIEELWFNQEITSIQLPQMWNDLANDYFKRKPAHQMEASLRESQWLHSEIGRPFEQLVSLLHIFDYKSFHTDKENSYEKFLGILRNGEIMKFATPCCLNFQELIDDAQIKSFLILLQQLQQKVVKQNRHD